MGVRLVHFVYLGFKAFFQLPHQRVVLASDFLADPHPSHVLLAAILFVAQHRLELLGCLTLLLALFLFFLLYLLEAILLLLL